MFDQYEPNVKATIAFLKELKIKVNNSTVDDTLQNHPDWPSLLCISDSLNKWNIPNAAAKIDVNEIDQLPTPFIACTHDRKFPLTIVTGVNSELIQLQEKGYGKTITISKADLLQQWNGYYLIAEPNEHSGEVNYAANKQKAFYRNILPFVTVGIVILLSMFLLQHSAIGVYIQYFILLTGAGVTSLLLWYEIDKNNPLLQKVCTGMAKGNCNAILTGKQAKLFSWLSWSEVGFFYFTGGLLSLLFIPGAITTIARLGILALPYTIFSVYYQWRVAKQW